MTVLPRARLAFASQVALTALVAAGIGSLIGAFTPTGVAFAPRNLVVIAAAAALVGVVATTRSAWIAAAITMLVSVAGSPRDLGGSVVDTRELAYILALVVLIRIALRGDPLRLVPRRSEGAALFLGWALIFTGSLTSTLMSDAGLEGVVDWLFAGAVLSAMMCLFARLTARQILLAILPTIAFVSLGGLAQSLGLPGAPARFIYAGFEAPRMDSFFGHPNGFATFMALGSTMALAAALLIGAGRYTRLLGVATFALCTIGVFLSASRAALGATAVAAVLPIAFSWPRIATLDQRSRRLAIAAPVGVALVAWIAFLTAGSSIEERADSGRLETNNAVRFTSMRQALPLIERDPFVGVGPHKFRDAVQENQGVTLEVPHAHNTLLTLWSERGLLAAMGFLIIALGPVGLLRRPPAETLLRLSRLYLTTGVPVVMVATSSVEYILDEPAGAVSVLVLVSAAWSAANALTADER